MPRATSAPLSTAQSHLEGSLAAVSLDRVLAACRRAQLTGEVRVVAAGKTGRLRLRAGDVARAEIGGWAGPGVLATLRGLRDGRFEVATRLPDGVAADGDPGDAPLAVVLRECADRALTCALLVTAPAGRAGKVARVEVNGFYLDDGLDQVRAWPGARFHVAAPRLAIDVPPAGGDEVTPLPPPPRRFAPPVADVTPLRELGLETAVTAPFARAGGLADLGPTAWALLALALALAALLVLAFT